MANIKIPMIMHGFWLVIRAINETTYDSVFGFGETTIKS